MSHQPGPVTKAAIANVANKVSFALLHGAVAMANWTILSWNIFNHTVFYILKNLKYTYRLSIDVDDFFKYAAR